MISGDVHYSFVYDVDLRHSEQSPEIWQITSSGIKNQFPDSILKWLDRINQILYAPSSPLNWLTKRRDLVIHERIPDTTPDRRLVSACGIGRVTLDDKGSLVEAGELQADDTYVIFKPNSQQN